LFNPLNKSSPLLTIYASKAQIVQITVAYGGQNPVPKPFVMDGIALD
jgi:hypothetical protein